MKVPKSDSGLKTRLISPSMEGAVTSLEVDDSKVKAGFRGGLVQSTLLVTFSAVVRIVLGIAMQMVLAAEFGAGMEMDAYLAATTIPALISSVFIEQLIVSFIPVFVEYKIRNSESEAWTIVSNFINLTFIVLGFLGLLGLLTADWMVRATVPGFISSGNVFALTTNLLRVLFPSIIFSGLAGLLSGVFYAQHKFTLPSLAAILNSMITLLVVFALANNVGIMSAALGLLIGSIAQFSLLFPFVLAEKHYRLHLDWRHPGVVKVAKLMMPLVLGASLYKANTVVDRFIGSGLSEGSISYLGYAFKIASILMTLVTQGLAMSIFPRMSEYAAANEKAGLRRTVSQSISVLTFMVAPLIIGTTIFGEQMIKAMFERGAFDHQATVGTYWALLCYLPWIFAGAIGTIITYAFYSMQETSVVVKVGVAGALLEVVLAVFLSRLINYTGLALALSITTMINTMIFVPLLRKRLNGMDGVRIIYSQIKVWCSATIMAGILLAGSHFLQVSKGDVHLQSTTPTLSMLALAAAGILSYLTAAWFLKCEEVLYLVYWAKVMRFRMSRGVRSAT